MENFLLDPDGPLMGFSADYIYHLSEEEEVISDRKDASDKIQKLEKALEITRRTYRETRPVDV